MVTIEVNRVPNIMDTVCRASVVVLALSIAACSGKGNPGAPTPAEQLRFPPALAPVIRTLDNDSWVHPLLGTSMGAYLRQHVKEIRFDQTLRPPTLAYAYPTGTIGWQSYDVLPTYDTPDVALSAAYVLHEARHTHGYLHTCGDGLKDRTFKEGGAWAVHVLYLEHAGFQAEADWVRKTFIGC